MQNACFLSQTWRLCFIEVCAAVGRTRNHKLQGSALDDQRTCAGEGGVVERGMGHMLSAI